MITRLVAALVGLAVLIPALVFGGMVAVHVVVALVLAVSFDEYSRMAFPGDDRVEALGFLALAGGGLYASMVLTDPEWWSLPVVAVVLAALAWGVLRPGPDLHRAADRVGRALVGIAWIAGLASFLPRLRALDDGLAWVFLAMVIPWLGDTGGYFAGRAFGRTKLYPRVSPKKTWEGLAGGLLLTTAGVILVKVLALPDLGWAECVLLGVVLGAAATLGDLAESLLKRSFDVKDSGWIMPGHGGLLDRIDSLLFVAPLLYAFAVLWQGA